MSADAALTDAGFGLPYGVVRLDRMTERHAAAGLDLRASVAAELEALTPHVEHIGSSAVVGLLAKPIVDLAVGSTDDAQWRDIRARLEALDWIYRGDAGDEGGHVFVLDAREWFRVAHLHVVLHEGMQLQNYLRFRDRLRSDPAARARYEETKLVLAARHSNDRPAYTEGKTGVVTELLRPADDSVSDA